MAGTALPAQTSGSRSPQRTKRLFSLLTAAVLAVGGAVVAPLAAQAAETPSFTTDVTEVADTQIDVQIDGTGYGDVQALPGQSGPGAYFTLIEKGSDLADVGQADTAISASIAEDGTVDAVLSVPASELTEGTDYEVISWPNRSFPTEANLYARADVDIDWAALFPAPAAEEPEEQTPSFTTDVTEVADTQIDVQIDGTGYGDVQALPGQSAPGAYFTLIEKGSDLANVGQADTAISATIAEDGTIDDVLTVPASDLTEGTDYEVISWPNRSFPTEANLYARADVDIDWAALFPDTETEEPEEQTPSFTTDVTEVADTRIDVQIDGTGYGDVQALPGQSGPGAYFTLIEKGSDLADVGQADTAISASIAEDGTVDAVLSVPASELTEGTDYEVISWPNRSFPTEANLYARADVDIDWAALFPAEEPIYTPELTVTPATDLDPEGDTVTVTGTGYDPNQAIYVFLCEDVELPANLWDLALGCRDGAKQVNAAGGSGTTFDEDGAFELELDVAPLGEDAVAVYTAANHTAPTDRGQDAKAAIAFAAAEEPEEQTPSFTTDVTEVADTQIDVQIDGTGYGDVQALPGQSAPGAYFTLIEKGSDLANVGQADTAISATIAEDGTIDDVLTVPASDLTEGTDYEVISWPNRSFPTEANLYARADVDIDWAALFPDTETEEPAETSVKILDEAGEEITTVTQGDEIVFAISGAEANTAFSVTVHSDPVVLDDVTTDENGTAAAEWTVPADFETGDHSIEFVDKNDGDTVYAAAFAVKAAVTDDDNGSDDDGSDDNGSGDDGADDSGAVDASADGGDATGDEGAAGAGDEDADDVDAVDDQAAAGSDGAADGELAVTGGEISGGLVAAAGALLLLGAGVMVASRRRTADSER